ncbi:MAG: MFS transporter [Clostridia bacterium]|nr:MFS transporter [Clostridia bacterium]
MNKRLVIIGAVSFLYWFSMFVYIPVVPALASEFGAGLTMIGLISGAFGAMTVLLCGPISVMSDHISNPKRFLLLGAVSVLLSGLIPAVFQSPVSLFMARALGGAASAVWIIYIVEIARCFPESEVSRASGFMFAVSNCGAMLGSFLSGYCMAGGGGRAPFIVAAAAGGIAVLLLLIYQTASRVKAEDDGAASGFHIADVLKAKHLIPFSILFFAGMYVSTATNSYFTPLYAEQALGAAKPQLGHLATAFVLAGILAGFVCPRVEKKLGAKRSLWISFIMMAVFGFAVFLIKNIWLLMLTQAVIGYGAGSVEIILVAGIIKNTGKRSAASVLGVFYSLSALGMIAGPFLTGILWAGGAGFLTIFTILALISVLAAVISARLTF